VETRSHLKELGARAGRGLRGISRRIRENATVGKLVESRFWRNRVFEGVVTALLVAAVFGVFSPAQFAKDSVGEVAGIFASEPPEASREVDSLFEQVRLRGRWRFPPSMSERARSFLESHWAALRPDVEHPFPRRSAKWRDLDEVFQDTSLDGHPLLMTGYVDQTFGTVPVEGRPDHVEASFRIATGAADAVGWCAPMLFRRGAQPVINQLVEIKGTVIARGDKPTSDGGFIAGSYMVCSAEHPLTEAAAASEVADLFTAVERSPLWRETPTLSEPGRTYLLYHWTEATPFRPHAFRDGDSRSMGIDQINSDSRFDEGEVLVTGFVTQHSLDNSSDDTVHEYVRLEVAGQADAVWCEGTLQRNRVIHEGEYVEAVGVPVARGASSLASGGFKLETFLACSAMRVPRTGWR
jgi:hypothetical protein